MKHETDVLHIEFILLLIYNTCEILIGKKLGN